MGKELLTERETKLINQYKEGWKVQLFSGLLFLILAILWFIGNNKSLVLVGMYFIAAIALIINSLVGRKLTKILDKLMQ